MVHPVGTGYAFQAASQTEQEKSSDLSSLFGGAENQYEIDPDLLDGTLNALKEGLGFSLFPNMRNLLPPDPN